MSEFVSILERLRPGYKVGGVVTTPKRGLVDEPGSYAGEQTKGIYTISELAKLDGMPFAYQTLAKDLVSKKSAAGKRIQKAFKDAGIELLPKTKAGQATRFKMLNATKSMEKLTDYAMTLDRPPKKFIEPYKKQIPIEYKKLIKSGEPFSVTDLKNAVFKSLPKNVYKVGNTGFDAIIRRALTEGQRKKFTLSTVIQQTEKLQPRKIIIDNVLDGKTNIKQLAKASNLSEKQVGEQIQRIFTTIYRSREAIGAKEKVKDVILKDYSVKDFEKILTNINKEPTLDSFFRQGYRDFLFEAIGNPNNPDTYQPKKYARAIERLKNYGSINQKLREAFGINLTLDHSVSRTALKSIVNAEPSQFLRVNPIPENINAGIKKSFDIQYRNVLRDLKSGQFRGEQLKNLLIQKAELEKLSKDIGLQFGKVSPTGKIIKYDAVDFLNKNLPSEIKAGVSLPNKIRQAVDKINPAVLKERFKVAFGDKADDALEILNKIKKQDNLQDIYKFLKPLLRVKGLRVDASDFLNQASEVIFPTLQAAEVLPGEAQAAIPKPKEPMSFDLDMSLPPKKEPGVGSGLSTKALYGIVPQLFTKGLRSFLTSKYLPTAFSPTALGAYAVDQGGYDLSKPMDRVALGTEAAFAPSLVKGTVKATQGIQNKALRRAAQQALNLGLPARLAMRAARIANPLGIASLVGEGLYGYGKFVKSELDRIKAMTPEERKAYNVEQQEQMSVSAASGGMIKRAAPKSLNSYFNGGIVAAKGVIN